MIEPPFVIAAAGHPSLGEAPFEDMAQTLSAESRYFGRRGRSIGPKPTPSLVRRLCGPGMPGDDLMIAVATGQLIGIARLTGAEGAALELWLAVVEPWRRRGVGAALAETAMARARTLGASRVVWHSSHRSDAALALARRLGFDVVDLGRGRVDLVGTPCHERDRHGVST